MSTGIRLWLAGLAAALLAATALWLIAPASYYRDAQQVLALCLALTTGALVFVSLARHAYPNLLLALHYLAFFFLLPALGQLSNGRLPFAAKSYPAAIAEAAAWTVLLFVLVLLAVSALAHFLQPPRPRRWTIPAEPPAWLVLMLCALSVAGALGFGYGRLNLLRGEADLQGLLATPGSLILQTLARAAGFLALLLAVAGLRHRRDLAWWALVAVALVVCGAANNPLTLPRFMLGAEIIIAALVLFGLPLWLRIALLGMVPALQVSVFPLLSNLARGSGGGRWDPLDYLTTHGDFDGFQSTMNVVALAGSSGLQWGRQLASAILFFLPSGTAPWKSAGTGVEAARFMGYRFTNISAPLPAEFFIDFGVLGVAGLTAALAWIMAWADRHFAETPPKATLSALLPAIAAGYAMILFRGSLVGVVGPFACMLLLARLVQRPTARRHPLFAESIEVMAPYR